MNKARIAVFHAFLKNKGGAEKVVLDICTYYNADLYVGAIDSSLFNNKSEDSFSKVIFGEIKKFVSLHEESTLPVWRLIKRQLYFLFSPKVTELENYDVVIFSGNVFWVPGRLRKLNPKVKIITYCHTPPRIFTDRMASVLDSIMSPLRPLYKIFASFVLHFYKKGLLNSDILFANSKNIQNRLQKYLSLNSTPLYPPISTERFSYIKNGDFYLSYSRLEDIKRIKLIVETFALRRDLRLVICSAGPLKDWVENEITAQNLTNVEFRGLVSDEELSDLVGSCKAGIVIPVDEDAGITQCEIMAAGKPVLGVAEGGLLETVIHKKTGYLIPANPDINDVISGLEWMETNNLPAMKDECILRAKEFDKQVFFDKLTKTMSTLVEKNVYEKRKRKA